MCKSCVSNGGHNPLILREVGVMSLNKLKEFGVNLKTKGGIVISKDLRGANYNLPLL